jgi:DNA-binding transcriptional LysR family regulator
MAKTDEKIGDILARWPLDAEQRELIGNLEERVSAKEVSEIERAFLAAERSLQLFSEAQMEAAERAVAYVTQEVAVGSNVISFMLPASGSGFSGGDVAEFDAPPGRRPRLDWDDIRVFVAVGEAGSINGAARALRLTPGTVSKLIGELELRLGAALVKRRRDGISLTDAGALILEHAASMERSIASIERAVAARDNKLAGPVSIEIPEGIAALWMAPHLADFHRNYPKITINLDCGFGLEASPDITITAQEDKRVEYVSTPLAFLHYAFFASPSYLSVYGAPDSLAAVAEHRLLSFTPAADLDRETWSARGSALATIAEFGLKTNSGAMLMHAMVAGAGIGIAPTAIRTLAPDLVMVVPEPVARVRLWLVHHRDAAQVARVRAVADWIKQIFDGRKAPWFREEFVDPDTFQP